ncbi:PepSY-associated TM helix domain-containing protein [Zavarzinia sp. CC-PAN008]|uniref:PepSY-associated TM helix domain-containing protein n=1 Tax=Zavarzinia sp. CC-PAN008 TaxID=3243332 RepID=UPI003F7433FE
MAGSGATRGEVGGQVATQPFRARSATWRRQLTLWHWISSALSLVGLLLFAVTGITLNHAAQIESRPVVTERTASLPEDVLPVLAGGPQEGKAALPPAIVAAVAEALALDLGGREAEWSVDDVYVALPRPGGDAWATIDRASGEVVHEVTDRGWVSYLNDLHKGRNAGTAWSWFIDILAGACVVFALTGLLLLQLHARNRPSTWPLVGAGLVVPVLLAILFIH